MVSLLFWIACGGVDDPASPRAPTTPEPGPAPTTPPVDEPVDDAVAIDPIAVLIRASLDLRGVRPSLADLEAVEADPAQLDPMIEGYLADPRFADRVVDQFSGVWLTRRDTWDVAASAYGLTDQPGFADAVGQEPLRILARIAAEDLPYTDLVTADWTMADPVLLSAWPLAPLDDQGDGWAPAVYTDGRPTAGLLTTNGMWWRYMSDANNANRGRANAVSKMLLCSDYLTRPIEFDRDVNLLDADAVNDALQTNPGCAACHSTLDPLASHMWGFYYFYYFMASDITWYHPDRERMWQDTTGVAPAYYGTPTETIEDLGYAIAGDPRFVECATQRVAEVMLQRETGLDDFATLTDWRESFLDNGLTLKSVYREVLASEEYRTTQKTPSPGLIASQLEDLTGFRFSYAGYDMMETDTYGLRVLSGGVDGVFVTAPADAPTPTAALVLERVTQAAAWHVMEHDRDHLDDKKIFTEIGFSAVPASDPDGFVRQIQALHFRLFGRRVAADSEEVAENLALWEALYDAEGEPGAAWADLLSVLLRDPDFVAY
jgi:hypothetical protein